MHRAATGKVRAGDAAEEVSNSERFEAAHAHGHVLTAKAMQDDLTQQLRGEIQKDTSQRLANVKVVPHPCSPSAAIHSQLTQGPLAAQSLREQIHQLTLEDAKPARPPGFDRCILFIASSRAAPARNRS